METPTLPDKGDNTSYVLKAAVEDVVWSDSRPERLAGRARTAENVLLPDSQYRKGTALYGQCGV